MQTSNLRFIRFIDDPTAEIRVDTRLPVLMENGSHIQKHVFIAHNATEDQVLEVLQVLQGVAKSYGASLSECHAPPWMFSWFPPEKDMQAKISAALKRMDLDSKSAVRLMLAPSIAQMFSPALS